MLDHDATAAASAREGFGQIHALSSQPVRLSKKDFAYRRTEAMRARHAMAVHRSGLRRNEKSSQTALDGVARFDLFKRGKDFFGAVVKVFAIQPRASGHCFARNLGVEGVRVGADRRLKRSG
jgi:hypothetical protein